MRALRRSVLGSILLVAVLFATVARADDEACRRTVAVTGRAQASQAPDHAEVVVGVEVRATNAAAALDSASRAATGIVALGRDLGVPAADIATAAVVLEPATRIVTDSKGTSRTEPDGYRAANRVSVRLADMGRLGDLLRRTLDAGANRIDSVSFGLNDPDAVDAGLEVAAAKDARNRAAALAEAVGAKLGVLCNLSTVRGPQPMAMNVPRPAPAPRRVPIEAGTIQTSAEVSATFAVAP